MTINNQIKRANTPVTLYTGCLSNSAPKGFSTISKVLELVRSDGNKAFRQFSDELKEARAKAPAEYKKRKESECPAFIIGRFSARKNDACTRYVPLLGFDIDQLGGMKEAVYKKLIKSPFVYAAFTSPSGQGLRFLVWCNNDQKDHKLTYNAVADRFSEILGISTDKKLREEWKREKYTASETTKRLKNTPHIDTGTNNIARLWFYTWVSKDEFYMNEESQIFSVLNGENILPTAGKNKTLLQKKTVLNKSKIPLATAEISEDQKVGICLEKVNRQNIAGGRNNFVFAFACEMARHGVSEAKAQSECMAYEQNGFASSEIIKSVSSAYQSKSREFSDQQIINYQAKVKGVQSDKKTESPRNKSKSKSYDSDDSNRPKFVRIRSFIDRRYDMRYNIITNEIETREKGRGAFDELNENDLICELLEAGFNGVETPLIALLKSSYVSKYDPLKEYFTSLPKWKEGDTDYINELANYIDAENKEWFVSQFKKMLVRLVAGALRVIPFNKHCFVFRGSQNDGKSSFVRFLCPPKLKAYYTEQINVQNKDGRITLCQNIIINLDELSQFRRQDINVVKALMSVDHVKERLPYDRKPTRLSRTASFFGSTNNDEFLVDATGSVRWLVVEVKKNGIKHDNGGKNGYTKLDIDLVYSQAYALLRSGFKFNLTREEIEASEKNNKRYQVLTVERELIQESFAPSKGNEPNAVFMTATEMLMNIETGIKTTITLKNVGQALRVLGFEQTQRYFKDQGYQKKGYWVTRLFDEG